MPRRDPRRRCLPIRDWPEPDRQAWGSATRPGDILDPAGGGSEWAFHSQRKIAAGYGRWLTWLDSRGLLELYASPAERVTPERAGQYFAELRLINAPGTVLNRAQELSLALRVIAPAEDWSWLRAIERRLRYRTTSTRNKRSRLVPINKLFAYGVELMTAAEDADQGTTLSRARQFRDGLMIALLAARPIRRRNFARIELGRHLVEAGVDYSLRFSGEETKTRDPIDAPVPAALTAALRRYLSEYRPALLARNGRWRKLDPLNRRREDALWVSDHGSAMTEIAIYFRFRKLTQERFGHVVNPHLFRDAAATSIAAEDPEHVQIISSILGHSSLATSERYYVHAQMLEASRRYQQRVLDLRRQPRHPSQASE